MVWRTGAFFFLTIHIQEINSYLQRHLELSVVTEKVVVSLAFSLHLDYFGGGDMII